MKTYTKEELATVIANHQRWAQGNVSGSRTDLSGADLSGADLRSADLRSVYLSGADLSGADLSGADLRGANLSGANLNSANLNSANLSGANLRSTDLRSVYLRSVYLSGANLRSTDLRSVYLRSADLRGADLRGADLRGADLRGVYLSGANLIDAKLPAFQIVPQEDWVTVFKKAYVSNEGTAVILKLRIPPKARRTCSLIGRKCRTERAKVEAAFYMDGTPCIETMFVSRHDNSFIYEVGKFVEVSDYDPDIRIECTKGIHFFLTREEATEY